MYVYIVSCNNRCIRMVNAPELLRWFSMITPASWLIRLLNQTDRTPYLSVEAYYQ